MSAAPTSAARRVALWLALLAMLMGALAPTVSRWLAATGDASVLVEVCRADGSRRAEPVWLKAGAIGNADHDHDGHHAPGLDHCGYCAHPVAGNGLEPASGGFAFLDAGRHALPALFLVASRPLSIWRTANPRAPPAHLA
ncbi:DUF2946 family protein [Derxia gummosa]|uniref:DUF2946 family protein n=1 Tax=Derxia gummosa DSM 723 TaxID=1121388 RepID=A0A8B6X578_9BURK|nr:DUF2946 family protein [Derxia gummosa]